MSGLPGVKFNISNDGLGQTAQVEDTIVGMILTGVAIAGAGNVSVGEAYQVFSLAGAVAIGITEADNAHAYRHIKEYYDQAGTGSELWFMLTTNPTKMSDMLDINEDFATKLINASEGRIRYLVVSQKSQSGVTVTDGLDEDVEVAVNNGQQLAQAFTDAFKPVRVIVDGKDFNGNPQDLKDYTQEQYNRVLLLIAGTGGKNASVGLLAGRLAANPVQRSIGRVRDGNLGILGAKFTNDEPVQDLEGAWNSIHDKGYTFLRTLPGKGGFYFTDDQTLTEPTDDFNSLKRVAVIDKAMLVALGVYVDNILDEIPVDESGQISPALIGNWQADVLSALNSQMTDNGEISGATAFIDPAQDILGSSRLEISIGIQPVGYAKYIEINLGFTTELD